MALSLIGPHVNHASSTSMLCARAVGGQGNLLTLCWANMFGAAWTWHAARAQRYNGSVLRVLAPAPARNDDSRTAGEARSDDATQEDTDTGVQCNATDGNMQRLTPSATWQRPGLYIQLAGMAGRAGHNPYMYAPCS